MDPHRTQVMAHQVEKFKTYGHVLEEHNRILAPQVVQAALGLALQTPGTTKFPGLAPNQPSRNGDRKLGDKKAWLSCKAAHKSLISKQIVPQEWLSWLCTLRLNAQMTQKHGITHQLCMRGTRSLLQTSLATHQDSSVHWSPPACLLPSCFQTTARVRAIHWADICSRQPLLRPPTGPSSTPAPTAFPSERFSPLLQPHPNSLHILHP
jgi:hypothetical protein